MVLRMLFFLFAFGLLSCGASKEKSVSREAAKATAILGTAQSFLGTPYRYGGATRRGMDCSGLVHTALKRNGIPFPRVSYHMAQEGKRIRVAKVQKGDLLYFNTGKSRRRINHVGLVVETGRNTIKFIHATTSQGVLVSSLRETYWKRAFVKAMRIL